MQLRLIISVLISTILIASAFWATSPKSGDTGITATSSVVTVNGTQVIDITAKGGYEPRLIAAKANVPTVLRVKTSGTYDCSASLVIPKLSYQKFLEPTAIEEIQISAEKATGTLQGLCSMGMYGFQIRFE